MRRFASLLRRVWAEDHGSVVTAEITLILAIFVIGLIPGLVALRNATNASMATCANIMMMWAQSGSSGSMMTTYQSYPVPPTVIPPDHIQVDPTP